MEEAAAQTAWEGEHWVYGLRLRPYSLLASLRLDSIGNPWSSFGMATVENTWVAAQICAAGTGHVEFKRFGLIRGFLHGLDRQIRGMRVYMRDYDTAPQYWAGQDDMTTSPETPWQYRMAVWAMSELRIDYNTVWTMPLNRLLWLRAAHEERLALMHGRPSPIYGERSKAAADMLAQLNSKK